nr:MAG TPA: hypothetical protein [Caudoviricetes sp.]DAZ71995.1 MAG TPA: hypothetical protein [Caudoviricetes sp.]
MSAPEHPRFPFFHYMWPPGSHHRVWKYSYYTKKEALTPFLYN